MIVLHSLLAGLLLTGAPADEFRAIFNGRDLDGWVIEGPAEYKDKETGKFLPIWTVRDGLIHCEGKAFGFLRYEKEPFGDFVFHVECRLAPKGNSGIGIRTGPYNPKRTKETRPSFCSYEIQILDDAGKPPEKHSTASLYRYVAPKTNAMKPAGEWNTFEITCQGPRIKVELNGQVVQDVDQSTIKEIKDKPVKGYVCLQSHSNLVEFRNVKIRELKAAGQ